jgi:hypothetical protein
VWKAYVAATQTDPATPRRGVTIDANSWDDTSHKLNFSVVYLAGQNNPEVPPPWSCAYDVTSKQIEPLPQPDAVADDADNSGQQQTSATMASENQFGGNETDEAPAEAEGEELPGEKFPATRLDQLEPSDVNESSLADINYAINEMYARHGVDFKDKKVSGQFSNLSWYKVRPGLTFADAEAEFDDLEKQNLRVLRQCRDAKNTLAHHRPVSRSAKAPEESTVDKILRGIKAWQDMGAPMPPHP